VNDRACFAWKVRRPEGEGTRWGFDRSGPGRTGEGIAEQTREGYLPKADPAIAEEPAAR
jgi:hypothetical protein